MFVWFPDPLEEDDAENSVKCKCYWALGGHQGQVLDSMERHRSGDWQSSCVPADPLHGKTVPIFTSRALLSMLACQGLSAPRTSLKSNAQPGQQTPTTASTPQL
jgi:hypothetical protein